MSGVDVAIVKLHALCFKSARDLDTQVVVIILDCVVPENIHIEGF